MLLQNPSGYGDLKKFIVMVDGKDITAAVSSVDIFQDIFTPTWTAHVILNDTTNLLMRLPLKAGSKISIEVETKNESPVDGSKKFKFYIYRIGDKVFRNHMQQTYTLFCAPKAFFVNQGSRVSKAFTGKKATEIADTVVKEYLGGKLDSNECEEAIDALIPNWTPMNVIAWCCKSATKKGAADYVFFQTDDDKYSMKSVEKLYGSKSESTGSKFIQKPGGLRDEKGDPEVDYTFAMLKYQVEHFDALKNLASGYYSSKKLSYDLINKKFETKNFKFGDDIEKDEQYKSWTDSSLLTDAKDANVTFMPKHPGMSESKTYLDAQDTWSQSRMSSVQKLDQEKLFVQVPGGVGFYKYVGKNTQVQLPSQQDQDDTDVLDKYRKGTYLITSVVHKISPSQGYLVNFQMVKKRLEEKVK